MLRKVRLYGGLAKFLNSRCFDLEVQNPAEAIRLLLANFPELEVHMSKNFYKIIVEDFAIDLEDLALPCGQGDIKIIPVIGGAGGVGRILAGVALIAFAVVTAGIGLIATSLAFSIGTIGASLVLGGVAQLISPVPTIGGSGADNKNDEDDPRKSFSFSGIQNTSRQGTVVPVVYGEVITGSIVISSGVDTINLPA
jgi:predicted phage tail protein